MIWVLLAIFIAVSAGGGERVSQRAAIQALAIFFACGLMAAWVPSLGPLWGLLALVGGSATVLAGKESV